MTPERVLVVLALLFGLGFALVSPPLDPADERRHLQRAFAISEGHWSAPGTATDHQQPPLLLLALPALRPMPRRWGPTCITTWCTAALAISVYSVAHHYFVGTPPPA